MIASLRGLLTEFGADHAVLDVNGVGYLVAASTRTLSSLGAIGDEVLLHTEMLVGEDFIRLVGFSTAAERDWFRLLVSVQGVGARVALANLGFRPSDAAVAVAKAEAEVGPEAGFDLLVRTALKKAAK